MQGSDVVRLQQLLVANGMSLAPYGADGDFGALTEKKVKQFQKDADLVVDGIVGKNTLNALMFGDTVPAPSPTDEVSALVDEFIQAANYRTANRTEVRWVMVHTMEAPEKPGTAEAVARWFAGQSGKPPPTSAHYCVDNDSIVLCVDESDVAWGCRGANRYSVHYELSGYAKQSAQDWSDDFSQAMLRRTAQQAAVTAARWGIPVQKIGPTEMRAGHKGFCGHVDGTKAFKKSTHYDPGPNFPWDDFLVMVKEEM
jgi:N-acetyl-anhydromuramyl-L-alanine amidase AmpD